jgi:hypothetical protein
MRRAVANMALDNDQSGCVFGVSKCLDCLCDPLRVVRVADQLHVPAVGKKASRNIVAKGEIGVAFNRYAVTVVQPA